MELWAHITIGKHYKRKNRSIILRYSPTDIGDPRKWFSYQISRKKNEKHFCFSFSGDIEEIFLSSAGGKVRDIFNTHLVQLEMN